VSLDRELADMRRLHDLSVRLLQRQDQEAVLNQVLLACTELLGANRGNVQLLDEGAGALRIVTQIGFDQDFLDEFQSVPVGHGSVCSEALARRERVVAEDVFMDERFQALRPTFARLGLSACTSTPLFDREGKIYGMLSNHFDRPHRPSERELQLLDLYVQQAERVIELRQVG
jgi:GAF domain-containing protein